MLVSLLCAGRTPQRRPTSPSANSAVPSRTPPKLKIAPYNPLLLCPPNGGAVYFYPLISLALTGRGRGTTIPSGTPLLLPKKHFINCHLTSVPPPPRNCFFEAGKRKTGASRYPNQLNEVFGRCTNTDISSPTVVCTSPLKPDAKAGVCVHVGEMSNSNTLNRVWMATARFWVTLLSRWPAGSAFANPLPAHPLRPRH
ncbi:hypothetical protein GALMADRAFT_218659 [Galerina marginata CBS 339.88]|uniref:Uncharacterized protein n=1 Tax=Galerina marginata (strain CBS 339.88) TaxID=685588 RepID=A0A067TQW8_GALM3|nr:hypothetical protein GALMADRAFT_218659 [Galerina marginata CBS 339.88]